MKVTISIDGIDADQVGVAFVQNEAVATLRSGQHTTIEVAEGDQLHFAQMSAAEANTLSSTPDEAVPDEPESNPDGATPEAEAATPSGLGTEPGDVPPNPDAADLSTADDEAPEPAPEAPAADPEAESA